jgi:uncharacterized protein with beta-barrel porin domain
MLDRFSLQLGGDVSGNRQTAQLLFGSGSQGYDPQSLVDDYTTLRVSIAMKPEDRQRIVWTSTADGYLTTSSNGNWTDVNGNLTDASGQSLNFNHSDYLVFDERGKQGEVILGKPIYDLNGNLTATTYGARTFSGLLISGGDYTFTGGDFFGIAADFGTDTATGTNVTMKGDVQIAAGNITFKNNLYTEGKIEIVNGATVTLTNNKAFHAEKELIVSETASLIIEPNSDIIRASKIAIAGDVQFINEPEPSVTNTPRFQNLISVTETPFDAQTQETLKDKIELSRGLWQRSIEFNEDNTAIDLIYKSLSINEYAQIHNFNDNNTAIANYFTQVFNNWGQLDFEKSLLNLNDTELLNLFSTLSNAVIHSEAKYMSLSNPYRAISNHFFSMQDVGNNNYNYSLVRGTPSTATRDIWFSINNHSLEMSGDSNAQTINTQRSGLNIGIDKRFGKALLAGILLSTGDAKLTQKHNGNRIDMEDVVFGFYTQYQFLNEVQLNSYIGLGIQKFNSKILTVTGIDNNYDLNYNYVKSQYDGDTAFWNVELIRPIHKSNVAFMPGFGIDIQYAHTKSFNVNDQFNTHISSSKINQIMVRTGFNSLWKINDRFRLETQSWYRRQIGGSDTLAMNISVPGINSVKPASLKGITAGRDYITLGIGSRYYLTNKKQSQLMLDYVFERGNRSKAHFINLGYNYNF